MQINGKTVQHLLTVTIVLSRLPISYSQCGGVTLELQSQLFTTIYVQSPNHNTGQYSQNLTCTWRIDSSVNSSQLMYTFHHKGMVNTEDVIKIYEGIDATGTPQYDTTNNLSQDSTITPVTSSDSLFIQFVTDDDPSNNGDGFDLYLLESMDASGAACSTTEQLQAQSTPQYITSPNFPQKYPTSEDCTWNVSSADGSDVIVSVIFMDVETQTATQCYDSLTVGDSRKLCANREWNTGLTFNFNESFLITFKSDDQGIKQGFALSYIVQRNSITQTRSAGTTESDTTTVAIITTSPELTDPTSPLDKTTSETHMTTLTEMSTVRTAISTDANIFSSTSTVTTSASHSTNDMSTESIHTATIDSTESTFKSIMSTVSESSESTRVSITSESTSVSIPSESTSVPITYQTTSKSDDTTYTSNTHTTTPTPDKLTTEQTTADLSTLSTVKTASVEVTTQNDIPHDSTMISHQETSIEYTATSSETSESVTSSIISRGTTDVTYQQHSSSAGSTAHVSTIPSDQETLPPAAVGAIIAGAIVGVAGVGIAMGAVVFLLFVKCTGEKPHKHGNHSNKKQEKNLTDDHLPKWIKMLDTMKKQRYNPTFLDF